MIINILLGLILGIVIINFIILNNKIINLYKLFNTLVDRLNYLISVDNDYFETINSSINDKFRALNYNDDCIKDRLNSIDSDVESLIITEHNITRNEIKKLAKISSKKKQASKQSKSINKQ